MRSPLFRALGLAVLFGLVGSTAEADFTGYQFMTTASESPTVFGPGAGFKGITTQTYQGSRDTEIATYQIPIGNYINGLNLSYSIGVSLTDLSAFNSLTGPFPAQGSFDEEGTITITGGTYAGTQTVGPAQSQVLGTNLYTVTPEVTFFGFTPEGPNTTLYGSVNAFIKVTPVPEPSSASLIGVGTACAWVAVRRRRGCAVRIPLRLRWRSPRRIAAPGPPRS